MKNLRRFKPHVNHDERIERSRMLVGRCQFPAQHVDTRYVHVHVENIDFN